MSKLVTGVVVGSALVIAGVLGTAHYAGGKVRQGFDNTAQQLSTAGVTVRVMEYQRGILKAQAKTHWSIQDEEDTTEFTVTHAIQHGPWPKGKAAVITSHLEMPQDADAALVQALNGRAPLKWIASASWSGESHHHMTSPELAVKLADGKDFAWGGLQSEWWLSSGQDAVKGSAQLPQLRIADESNTASMEKMDIQMDARQAPGRAFWTGPFTLRVKQLTLGTPDPSTNLQISDLLLDTKTLLRDDVVDITLKTQIAKGDFQTYSASELALEMQFNNLDATWMDGFMRWSQGDLQDDQHRAELLKTLPALLSRQPKAEITRWSMRTPEGISEVGGSVAYVGNASGPFNPMRDLSATLRASVPTSLVQQLLEAQARKQYASLLEAQEEDEQGYENEESTEGYESEEDADHSAAINSSDIERSLQENVAQSLRALQDSGWVKKQGDSWTSQLKFDQGAVTLNGKPVSLLELLSMGSQL